MPSPVGYTCKSIDSAIGYVSHTIELLKEAVSRLEAIEGELEDLRDENRALRNWGEALEDERDELLDENRRLQL